MKLARPFGLYRKILDGSGQELLFVRGWNRGRISLNKGSFPALYDFNMDWGCDTKPFRNVDPEAFALANDGAGTYWLLTTDGAVRSWCHDEGGVIEDHNGFASLDDALACLVRYTAVRTERVPLDDVRAVFEEKGVENGWSFFLEILDEA